MKYSWIDTELLQKPGVTKDLQAEWNWIRYHIGSYDTEPETLRQLDAFAAEQGYCPDFSDTRFHHEIYLGDPRRTAPEKLKTVLRHPIRKMK
mgnify:FL=1